MDITFTALAVLAGSLLGGYGLRDADPLGRTPLVAPGRRDRRGDGWHRVLGHAGRRPRHDGADARGTRRRRCAGNARGARSGVPRRRCRGGVRSPARRRRAGSHRPQRARRQHRQRTSGSTHDLRRRAVPLDRHGARSGRRLRRLDPQCARWRRHRTGRERRHRAVDRQHRLRAGPDDDAAVSRN